MNLGTGELDAVVPTRKIPGEAQAEENFFGRGRIALLHKKGGIRHGASGGGVMFATNTAIFRKKSVRRTRPVLGVTGGHERGGA